MNPAGPYIHLQRNSHILCGIRLPVVLCALIAVLAEGARSEWNGYRQIDFKVDGRGALLVVPKHPAPGNHWIWRTEFFGVEAMADIALLDEGIYVAYIGVGGLFGAPVALDAMDKFYDHVVKTYTLNPKVVLEGFSRGGLYAFNWAARHPDRIAALYVDAPVCDFKSWPGGQGRARHAGREWREVLSAYGFTNEEALAYKLNPVDNLAPLAKEKIPILAVIGDMHDWIVPIEENTLIVEQRYKDLGGEIQVIRKPKAGHRPHSLPNPTPIVNFVLKHTTGGEMPAGKWAAQEAKKALAAKQTIDTIPLNAKPDQSAPLTSFECPADIGDFYGARVRGFVYPPTSGAYIFGISSDDDSKLFLSPDKEPGNKELIAHAPEWTEAKNYRKFLTQKSKPIRLEAGRPYYIEAIHKENSGGDNLTVGWITPGESTFTTIPGMALSPYPSGQKGSIAHDIWRHQETWPERRQKP